MKYRNPVIPGFYPDPSICRVGEDYYLVNSTFEYFPGVPVFYSKDLIHWRKIGHCLTRESQLFLEGVGSSSGIFAPTLRYHQGRFYMITTNMSGYGHFYVSADDPAGEWSEPIRLEGPGFDPDLFFDDDGKVYFTREDISGKGILQWEIDLATGRLLGEERCLWKGFEDHLCEGPHIYKINGHYYLLVAEGGTHRGHMVVIARSDRPIGPFEGCPHNPILTHRGYVTHHIQATGHGDLVQAHDGSWWMVFLGIRSIHGFHHLGRETFLAPVTWTPDGWPVVNENMPIEIEMEADSLPERNGEHEPLRDDFNNPRLGLCWNFRRNPKNKYWSLTEQPGSLRLTGAASTLNDMDFPSFIGRRQEHFNMTVSALLSFNPRYEREEAGLVVLMNEGHHYEIALTIRDGVRQVIVRRRVGDLEMISAQMPVATEEIVLEISSDIHRYYFCCGPENGEKTQLAAGMTRYISTEVAGGFTGIYVGMYATGNGRESSVPAYFDWFEYIWRD